MNKKYQLVSESLEISLILLELKRSKLNWSKLKGSRQLGRIGRLIQRLKHIPIKYRRWMRGAAGLDSGAREMSNTLGKLAVEARQAGDKKAVAALLKKRAALMSLASSSGLNIPKGITAKEVAKIISKKQRTIINIARSRAAIGRKLVIAAGVLPPILTFAAGITGAFAIAKYFEKRQRTWQKEKDTKR